MKTLESMKQFIRENNFTALVNELVTGADMDVADAVEYVYDMKTLSRLSSQASISVDGR